MDSLLYRGYGEVQKGQLHIFDRKGFLGRIQEIGTRRITIEVHVREGTISNQMRRYYFGVLLKEVQRAFWNVGYEYDLETLDHTFRMKALYREVVDEDEQKIRKEPHSLKDSDTEVTLKQFIYYIEYIIRFCAQNLDWSVAFPNEILSSEDVTEKQFNSLISQK